MSDSLFSRDYFSKRGSWTAGQQSHRSSEEVKAKKRSSVLYSTPQAPPQKAFSIPKEPSSILYADYINGMLQNVFSQKGSREMQQAIKNAGPEMLEEIVQVVRPKITQLMTDQYGNYMVQTLLQSASCVQRIMLLNEMRGALLWLSKDVHGTHSLQTVITMISLEDEDDLFKQELEDHITELSMDASGTHVVQKLLVHLRNNEFILRQIVAHALELATNQVGLCVIKKAISHGNMSHTKAMLQAQLIANTIFLIQDPYGNYAIQHLLDELGPVPGILSQLHGKVISLAMQKYSSNVIEKVLRVSDVTTRRKMITEMSHKDRVVALLGSLYGCFVLKAAAKVGDETFKRILLEEIEALKSSTQNRKLHQRWQSIQALISS